MPGRSHLRPALAAVLGAVALLAAVSGCSGPAGAATPAPAATPTVLDATDLRLPAADYLLTPQARLRMDRASQALVTACVKRYGLEFTGSPPAPRSEPATVTEMRYGVANAEQARTTGYHFGPANRGYLPPTGEVEPAPNKDAGYQLVLNGNGSPGKNDGTAAEYRGKTVGPGGCMAEMTKRLSGRSTFLGEAALVQQVDARSFDESLKAPAVQKVFRAWSACMREKGFTYATPLDAVNDPAFGKPEPAVGEQRTAQADVACKQQHNVVGVWFATEVDRQNALMAPHAAELRTVKIQMGEQDAVVTDVLRVTG
ncbi:hypothetical protein [Kitasatospora sp. NBC_01539]|uniref:hypothetical protein n=1 Tax=Kitasatospora sp. NBC_01539 TaxID=2903577 RepID=UPI0038601C05